MDVDLEEPVQQQQRVSVTAPPGSAPGMSLHIDVIGCVRRLVRGARRRVRRV